MKHFKHSRIALALLALALSIPALSFATPGPIPASSVDAGTADLKIGIDIPKLEHNLNLVETVNIDQNNALAIDEAVVFGELEQMKVEALALQTQRNLILDNVVVLREKTIQANSRINSINDVTTANNIIYNQMLSFIENKYNATGRNLTDSTWYDNNRNCIK